MSKTATITISWTVTGDEANGVPQSVTSTVTPTGAQCAVVPLAAGRNQIFFPGPPTFTKVLMIPPSNSTNAKTFDSASATGGALDPAGQALLPVPSGSTSIYIGSAGTEQVTMYFF